MVISPLIAWWHDEKYRLSPDGVMITPKDHEYFDSVEATMQTTLDIEQRAWYVATRKEFEDLTEDQKSCIAEISTQTRQEVQNKGKVDEEAIEVDFVKIKLWDKQKSLDAINKMLGFDAATKLDLSSMGEKLTTAPPINVFNNAPPLSGTEEEVKE